VQNAAIGCEVKTNTTEAAMNEKRHRNLRRITSKKMGNYSNETLQLQKPLDDEEHARNYFLSESYLDLDEDTISWILNDIDCFVDQSRGNENVRRVTLCLHCWYSR
jgi:hypothetical protein